MLIGEGGARRANAVSRADTRALHGSLGDAKLMSEREDLDLHGSAGVKGPWGLSWAYRRFHGGGLSRAPC